MFLKLYSIALPIFIAMDLLWIGLVAKSFYAKQIGYLLRSDVNWYAAIAFYLLFITGIVAFVIGPAVEKDSWAHYLCHVRSDEFSHYERLATFGDDR